MRPIQAASIPVPERRSAVRQNGQCSGVRRLGAHQPRFARRRNSATSRTLPREYFKLVRLAAYLLQLVLFRPR